MSPPRGRERLAALAALSGSGADVLPDDPPGQARLTLGLIGRARTAGATWAAVGTALAIPGGPKTAKREARRLAAAVAAGKPYQLLEYL